jgi:hypothetical protein
VWEDLGAVKKNRWSLPRTVSCLSNINSPKHIATATDLIKHHKRTGNVFINLTSNNGLLLYASIPKRLKHKFIGAFKQKPKVVIGLTKTHLIIHTIKVFHKYGMIALLLPIIGISLILSMIPNWLLWTIFISSTGYLILSVITGDKDGAGG